MENLKYIFFLILLMSLTSIIFAEGDHPHQLGNSLGDRYYSEAIKAQEKKDYSSAFKLLQESAKNNNAKANEILGQVYSFGIATTKPEIKVNTDLAIEYMSRAVELGDESAKKMLISFQLKGWGKTSPEKIRQLRSVIEEKVQNSNEDKVANLLELVDSYLFIKQNELFNIDKAEYFANQLLKLNLNQDQKLTISIFCKIISLTYISGLNGVQKNPKKAFQWMKAAADLGLKEAYYNLSDMYFYGFGTPVNFQKSLEMIRLGDKLKWPRYDHEHRKHFFSIFLRPFVYLNFSK